MDHPGELSLGDSFLLRSSVREPKAMVAKTSQAQAAQFASVAANWHHPCIAGLQPKTLQDLGVWWFE